MSKYENYTATSQHYDRTRLTPGINEIKQSLETCAKTHHVPADRQILLDAGCGTGNYIEKLKSFVGEVYGLELNEGMLEQAKAKFANCTNVNLAQGSITKMPFTDNYFHGVIVNHVLHHLDDPNEQPIGKNVNKTLSEIYRVLKPGGVFTITTTDPQQMDGFWWAELIPSATQMIRSRLPKVVWLRNQLEAIGFHKIETIVPSEMYMPLDTYLDIEGPFSQEYRNGDSTWSLVTPEELKQGLDLLRRKIDSNEGESYLKQREELRHKFGQLTLLLAYK